MRLDDRSAPGAPAAGLPADRRAVVAWCLYDWANSAFPTIVSTFLFGAYFTAAVAESPEIGTAQWGWANAVAAIVAAVLSPVLGAIADNGGARKPWLAGLTAVCVLGTASLWFVEPAPTGVTLALAAAVVATLGFELGTTFYNAMLPDLVATDWLGRVSGWAWGLGYAGGLVCLGLGLLLFVGPDPPRFGLDRNSAEHVRIVMPMAALWFALFCLPLFLFVPDRASTGLSIAAAARRGIAMLWTTIREVRRHANTARFLLAKMIYMDGLNTLFLFGGTYAAGSIGMSLDEVLIFGILLNISAGLGAALFAWVDDWIGAKRTILISLAALVLLGVAVLLVESKTWFYVIAVGIGFFLGPTQAASRSFMARVAPPAMRTEFFGLYALAGRVTSFVGPVLVGWVTLATDSQRLGMATVLPFFVVGMLVLLTVKDAATPRRDA